MNILSSFLYRPEQITMRVLFSPASHQIIPTWRIPSHWKCTSLCDPVGRAVQRRPHLQFPYWFPFFIFLPYQLCIVGLSGGKKNATHISQFFPFVWSLRAHVQVHLHVSPPWCDSLCPNLFSGTSSLSVLMLSWLPCLFTLFRVKWDLLPLKEN